MLVVVLVLYKGFPDELNKKSVRIIAWPHSYIVNYTVHMKLQYCKLPDVTMPMISLDLSLIPNHQVLTVLTLSSSEHRGRLQIKWFQIYCCFFASFLVLLVSILFYLFICCYILFFFFRCLIENRQGLLRLGKVTLILHSKALHLSVISQREITYITA